VLGGIAPELVFTFTFFLPELDEDVLPLEPTELEELLVEDEELLL